MMSWDATGTCQQTMIPDSNRVKAIAARFPLPLSFCQTGAKLFLILICLIADGGVW